MSEYKQLFLSEAQEILSALNNGLIYFEKEPADTDLLNELFRLCHTLKSMAQSMEYDEITKLTHSMETVLTLMRSGSLRAEKDTVDLLFRSVDALGDLLDNLRKEKPDKIKIASLAKRFKEIISAVSKEMRTIEEKKTSEEILASASVGIDKTVRVHLSQLDSLMDLTGELIINKSRLDQITKTITNNALDEAMTQMSNLISQLQDQMMLVRLVPIEYIFAPYPRMVRDMAVKQNKEVDFQIEGNNIGMDRSIQDEINEPLLHLLKNAVTHGIEEPKEREGAKKPKRGTIKLTANREKNSVVLNLSDDGEGIDVKDVKDTALEMGMITKEELSTLTPKEALMLICLPGYTRTKKVSEAAGRGVGLNVVRVKVESFGGTLNIDSKPNKGTTVSIKLPLTMAIVQAMLIGIADETYCIPFSYIVETILVSKQEIKTIEQKEVISYRDEVLPLIRLRDKFGYPNLESPSPNAEISEGLPSIPIIVVKRGSKKAGLVADFLIRQQEVVVKPLTGLLKGIKGISGATILGTGRVALLVDVGFLL